MKQDGVNPIIFDAGDLFFSTHTIHDSIRRSEEYRASAIIQGYEKIGCDAINVGQFELANGLAFLLELSKSTSIPFISANLKNAQSNELIFDPFITIKRSGITIGVIGLTDLVPDSIPDVVVDDFIFAGQAAINKLKNDVDIIVLLVNSARSSYQELPSFFSGANLIFTSGSTMMTRPMMNQVETGPFLFSSGREGRYLNQVDLFLDANEKSLLNKSYFLEKIKFINRRIDRYGDKDPEKKLEDLYRDQPGVLNAINKSKAEIERMRNELEEAENWIEFQNIPMGASIQDDSTMFSFVKDALAKCSELKVANSP